jgi:hypothetical protein
MRFTAPFGSSFPHRPQLRFRARTSSADVSGATSVGGGAPGCRMVVCGSGEAPVACSSRDGGANATPPSAAARRRKRRLEFPTWSSRQGTVGLVGHGVYFRIAVDQEFPDEVASADENSASLLVPERHHRIDARGANGRYQAGGGGHGDDERHDPHQRRGITWADSEEQRLHQPRQHQCAGEAGH